MITGRKGREKRSRLEDIYVRIQHQIKVNRSLYQELSTNPESSVLVSYSIISILVMFYVGVIYPLSFMPVKIDATIALSLSAFWGILVSSKGILLASVSMVFTLLLMAFLVINHRLKYDPRLLDQLHSFTKLENYNEPLSNMVINQHIPSEVGLMYQKSDG